MAETGKKIRLKDLLGEQNFVGEALDEVKAELTISDREMARLEKKVSEKVVSTLTSRIQEELIAGNSVEIPNTVNIGVLTSSVRNYKKDGEDTGRKKRTARIRTREAFIRSLNN